MHSNSHSSSSQYPARSRGLASALACLIVLASGPALAEAIARQVNGLVELGRGEPPVWSSLSPGDPIGPSDRVRTGADGRVEISLAAGTIRVHENSLLRLPPAEGDADQVRLDEGHSLFDVLKRAGRRFEVRTPTVVVSVKGTRFGVDARRPIGEVAVYRGVVGVRVADVEGAVETLVREGFLAAGGRGVPIELDLAPGGDPWVGWQDFQRDPDEPRQAPARLHDLGRAKKTLQRTTDADVIERAAQRRPEVAEQLDRLRQQRAAAAAKAAGASPAAPLLGLAADEGESPRGALIDDLVRSDDADADGQDARSRRQRVEDQIRETRLAEQRLALESLLRGSEDPGSGVLDSAFGQLNEQFGSALVPVVVDALNEVDEILSLQSSTYTFDDALVELETVLVTNGMDPGLASSVVGTFIND